VKWLIKDLNEEARSVVVLPELEFMKKLVTSPQHKVPDNTESPAAAITTDITLDGNISMETLPTGEVSKDESVTRLPRASGQDEAKSQASGIERHWDDGPRPAELMHYPGSDRHQNDELTQNPDQFHDWYCFDGDNTWLGTAVTSYSSESQ